MPILFDLLLIDNPDIVGESLDSNRRSSVVTQPAYTQKLALTAMAPQGSRAGGRGQAQLRSSQPKLP